MNPTERAIKLIETVGYSKALSLARRIREKAEAWDRYHKWDDVYNKIKQHDSKRI